MRWDSLEVGILEAGVMWHWWPCRIWNRMCIWPWRPYIGGGCGIGLGYEIILWAGFSRCRLFETTSKVGSVGAG